MTAGRAAPEFSIGPDGPIPLVDLLPNLPNPYSLRDWKRVAREYDALVFDRDARGLFLPLIWEDRSRHTFDRDGFGIYTVPRFPGQGPDGDPAYHEGVNCVAAVVGASLVSIDKSDQDGHDYVRMCEQYFSPSERGGIDIFVNLPMIPAHTQSMWYFLYPNMLAFFLVHCYPANERLESSVRRAADQIGRMVPAFDGGEWFTGYDFTRHVPTTNSRWTEGDAPAGVAWIQYMAAEKFGDATYLQAAGRAMDALLQYERSPFYEILLPFGATLAARMNAEAGAEYDVTRLLNWCFDGESTCRPGWGVLAGNWNGYDVAGLQGSLTDGGGYAFTMNSFSLAAALAPLPRYDPRYARFIGKLLLNTANAARLLYSNGLPPENQTCWRQRGFARDVIAYEGLRKVGLRPQDAAVSPCAAGDPLGGRWGNRTFVSDFSLYGSSHVGFLAAVIDRTEVDCILRVDCLATDWFHRTAYPTTLIFNPYDEPRVVTLDVGEPAARLYETVRHRFVSGPVSGRAPLHIEPDSAMVLVATPAGGTAQVIDDRLLVDGVVVDFHRRATGTL